MKRFILIIVAGLMLAVLSSTSSAGLIHQFVTGEYLGTDGQVPYHTVTTVMHLDPAKTTWLAWSDSTELAEFAAYPGQEFITGMVDDWLDLTVTNPLETSSKVTMDYNSLSGQPSGQQNLIFGQAQTAPDAYKTDNYQNVTLFDESGAFNSLFTIAGDYTFTFEFHDLNNGYGGGHSDIYLLGNIVPEPATLLLLGLGGLTLRRRK